MSSRQLTVLYDAECALCCRARRWLEAQTASLRLNFVAAGSDEARRLFPQLETADTLREITVVDDQRQVFRGAKAWLVCLWALPEHRSMALDLASPELMPMARRFIAWVSENRQGLSRLAS